MDEHGGLTRIAAEYLREVDRAVGGALKGLARRGVSITCGKGCHWCCYLPVRATVPEAALAASYIREDFMTHKVFSLKKKLKAWLEWNEGRGAHMSASADGRFEGPGCPFLDNGICAIYPVRPMGCRVHSSTADPALCGPNISPRPSDSLPLFNEPGTVHEILDAVKPVCLNYRRKLEDMGLHFEALLKLLPEAVLMELEKG